VLRLIGFRAVESPGDELRGPCPIHGSSSAHSRSFAANVRKNTLHCFKCGAKGNQLDLWVAVSKLPLFDAARDLCEQAGIDVPEVRRW
ncbi:MAG TPA: CHC2 zinc finger domain-containing protein, partial [Pirellulaceae bacterium]|nr:CHC2 zinc finger domain-containing protein [Pirellulaceae bacterium]